MTRRRDDEPIVPVRDFDRLLREQTASGRYQLWRAFADFAELSAIAATNFGGLLNAEREKRYLKIVEAWDRESVERFAQLFAVTACGVIVGEGEKSECVDFLGSAFQRLELASHWHGQFFTPMSLARMMAEVQLGEDDEIFRERGYATLLEPASGSGVMVLAFANAMRARGLDPREKLHATLVDKDPTAAHMATIQLSLAGIPAVVWVGDSLSLSFSESFMTPAHVVGGWGARLAALRGDPPPASPLAQPPDPGPAIAAATGQLQLFS